jgi:hypothetical protein
MNTEKEILLARYIDALFAGDFQAQADILENVIDDAALVQELWNTNIAMGEELVYLAQANQVHSFIEDTLGTSVLVKPQDASAFAESDIEDFPLSIADVAANLRSEIVGGGIHVPDREKALEATEILGRHEEAFPEDALSERGARTLLHRLNVRLGRWFEDIFHSVAFDLEMGRRENLRLQAARRRKIHKPTNTTRVPSKEQQNGE